MNNNNYGEIVERDGNHHYKNKNGIEKFKYLCEESMHTTHNLVGKNVFCSFKFSCILIINYSNMFPLVMSAGEYKYFNTIDESSFASPSSIKIDISR